jgi:hypothetical protein
MLLALVRRCPALMKPLLFLLVLFAVAASVRAQQNLVPNFGFTDPTPLKGWRVDFPYQDWYKKNVTYVKQTTMSGRSCAMIELPQGVAGNEGGKVETALIPAVPGATYHAEVEALLPDFSAKIHAECYAVDPRDEDERKETESKGTKISIMRIPEGDGHPPLVMIYRKQFPDPPKGKSWARVSTDFTLPMEWDIAGEPAKPAFLVIKAFTYEGTQNAGRAYFTNFKLFKTKDPGANAAPQAGILR